MENVEKIKINISRIINIGGYENITYSSGVEISGFDGEHQDTVDHAMSTGRKLCLEDVDEFYNSVKQNQQKGEALSKGSDKKYLDIEKKINGASNEAQLRSLEDSIKSIVDTKMGLAMQKKFNLKLIELKNE